MENNFSIKEIRINEMTTPIGIDIEKPVFSWLLESEATNMRQTGARIRVGTALGQGDCWDSGKLQTDRSIGISYGGSKLRPRTRYYVHITVWDQSNQSETAETWFETGLMNGAIEAWHGAQWIGAPEYLVASNTISVFVLESTICFHEGDRAGIVFGANDERLSNKYKNEMLLEGESYIRFVVNIGTEPASLEIIRVGYAPEDCSDKPLYVFPILDAETGVKIISKETKHQPHDLKIEVVGNAAYTWIDGHPIDKAADGEARSPKCLNPLGSIDVTTFPRLCSVGYYAGENTRVSFPKGIHIRNLREPGREIAAMDSEGKELAGAAQEIRDPSCHALPMLRRKFTLNKELKKARLYATARGIYSIRVNGAKISDGFFAPGASQFDRHLMYQTYDVTEALTPGTNIVGCILASGWWSDAFSFRLHNYNYWGDKPSFLACLILTYDDGTEDVIVTDIETWDYFGEGPFLYAGFFNGEHFDARRTDVLTWFFQSETDNLEMKRPAGIQPVFIPEKKESSPARPVGPR